MSLLGGQSSESTIDSQLQDFIDIEVQKQRFQGLVHNLTDICWDTCIDKPSSRLEARTENCLKNCVDRFIDTTNFITNRLERIGRNNLSELDDE
ncbi:mitochondrial import inner membrane translocase subunit Tim8 A [Prorops nasuta]|uniref:mitochondrial import inner membrane translocase subunit Tim8 A n=1 Tax=Prorops nasuta TaxID=863751 RepID=UPI0034CD150A